MSIEFLENYKIAPTQSEYKKDKNYIGYKTKTAIYLLSVFDLENTPSLRVTEEYGAKCFSTGKWCSLTQLEKILKRGWIESHNFRRLPLDKYKKMYNIKDNPVVHWNGDEIPF